MIWYLNLMIAVGDIFPGGDALKAAVILPSAPHPEHSAHCHYTHIPKFTLCGVTGRVQKTYTRVLQDILGP